MPDLAWPRHHAAPPPSSCCCCCCTPPINSDKHHAQPRRNHVRRLAAAVAPRCSSPKSRPKEGRRAPKLTPAPLLPQGPPPLLLLQAAGRQRRPSAPARQVPAPTLPPLQCGRVNALGLRSTGLRQAPDLAWSRHHAAPCCCCCSPPINSDGHHAQPRRNHVRRPAAAVAPWCGWSNSRPKVNRRAPALAPAPLPQSPPPLLQATVQQARAAPPIAGPRGRLEPRGCGSALSVRR